MKRWATTAMAALAAWPLATAAAAERAVGAATMTIDYDGPPELRVVEMGGEEVISGRVSGVASGAAPGGVLAGATVDCPFVGRAYEGRSFSCGFTTIEEVRGYCVFTDEDGDQAVADWTCSTGATMTSDARCEGKAVWVSGSGKFAGVGGVFTFHSELFRNRAEGNAVWRGEMDLPMRMLGLQS